MRGRRCWIVGYDITSPKRLRRVARELERRALRLQRSLFLGVWTEQEFNEVWTRLAGLIHVRRDDVRAWPVPESSLVEVLGRGLPDGVVFGDARVTAVGRLLAKPGTTAGQ
jgi:CRISPR-associated protein Cas2